MLLDNSVRVMPIAGALGAELSGVDLSSTLDDATVAAIRQAWLAHGVVFFRDQDLLPDRLLGVARRFGSVLEYPFVRGLDEYPDVIPVVKLEHERSNFGGVWHTDTAYLPQPPMGTMLVAREVPPFGGDTLFASQVPCVRSAVGRHAADVERAARSQQLGQSRREQDAGGSRPRQCPRRCQREL